MNKIISCFVLSVLVAGCAHPGRGPASDDAHAWKRDGPCEILHVDFPRDPRDAPGGRTAFAAMDPATKARFITPDQDGCRRMKYKVAKKEIGVLAESPAVSECQVFGGAVIPLAKDLRTLPKVYRWTDPKTGMTFNALEDARCTDQGFTKGDEPIGFGNP